jgi:ABC-type nitrate/sulfonate/bicarbonate transport system substrate-binding protein
MGQLGDGRILMAQHTPPLQDNYRCAVVVPRTLVHADRQRAAAITRALMQDSGWIRAHPDESAQLLAEGKRVTASLEDDRRAMAMLDFFPSVDVAQRNTLAIVQQFKRLGLLEHATAERGLLERIGMPVTGVATIRRRMGHILRRASSSDAGPHWFCCLRSHQ